MGCRLLLLGLALCGMAHATPPPRIDLAVTPAWKGWSRPGRATEVDIRLGSDLATRVTLDLLAGRQTVHAELDLEPGRVMRLHLPVGSAERVAVSVAAPTGPPERREIGIAQSESPLLGVGLANNDPVQLEGFHTVALAGLDLPHNAAGYAGIDALILDAPTLGALDQRQLAALLTHAAGCGRIVLVNTDPRLRRVLDAAAGCGRHALMSAATPADASELLKASLSASLPTALTQSDVRGLARPAEPIWNRIAVMLAVYIAAAALALLFFSSLPLLLLTPALAALAMLTLLHVMQPPQQLVVWSEGESGAPLARYQAWQQFAGLLRERVRVPIPAQLAPAAQPCEPAQPMRFDFDAGRGVATFAEFETRLFRRVSLCYSGSFPIARAIAVEAHSDGSRQVRNAGTRAWPHGVLLSQGRVHDLPALGPGELSTLDAPSGQPGSDAALRLAIARTRPDRVAALWALELSGVGDVPAGSRGWLLVSVAPP